MKRFSCLLALPVLLGAASPATVPAPSPADVHAAHAWVRYLLPNLPASGYMTLTNTGDITTRLVKASSPACGALMLHESVDDGGTAMMTMVKSLTIPAHGQVSLAEGGYHLMCLKPKMALGSKIGMTLSFSDGDNLLLLLPVYGPGGPTSQ
ncbi:MAG: copper chaperone PCu(A)C [Rhodospirillales bacterium]|nr:copper chaperone PCu(A)C [Rhodospirillales bacterium]MDE2319587.1 copper chaperone PCu(A)C [Rhodospirillales bacterium]